MCSAVERLLSSGFVFVRRSIFRSNNDIFLFIYDLILFCDTQGLVLSGCWLGEFSIRFFFVCHNIKFMVKANRKVDPQVHLSEVQGKHDCRLSLYLEKTFHIVYMSLIILFNIFFSLYTQNQK
jgi:hypothetical protein